MQIMPDPDPFMSDEELCRIEEEVDRRLETGNDPADHVIKRLVNHIRTLENA